MNYVEHIVQQCATLGSEPALSLGGLGPDIISYSRLGSYLDAVCGVLHRAGVQPGSLYGVFLDNNLHSVVASLALNRLGAVPVAFNAGAAIKTMPCAAIITNQDVRLKNCPVWRMDDAWLLDEAYRPEVAPPDDVASQLHRIIFTSGSTGVPKPVALTNTKLAANIAQQDLALGQAFTRSKRRLCYIGPATLFGHLILLRTLAEGGLFCFRDSEDMARESRRIAMYGVEVLTASPGQLTFFTKFGKDNPGAFSSLKLVTTAGSLLPAALAARVRKFVCPNLVNGYGSSEAGVVAAAPVERLDLEKSEVGFVIPGVEISVVDPTTRAPITEGRGVLRLRGPGVVRSYYGQAAEQDSSFDGDWFCPGDIAALSSDGLLTLSGRQDGVVNIGGVKTTAEAIEAILHAAPGVADVTVAFVPDHLGVTRVLAMIVPAGTWSEPVFWQHCSANVTSNFRPVRLVIAPAIPRGGSGKIDRPAVAAMLNAAFKTPASSAPRAQT